jgi:hypothetical protein
VTSSGFRPDMIALITRSSFVLMPSRMPGRTRRRRCR